METDDQKKTLLDYNLFDLLGLELEEADQIQIESMIYKSAISEFLETALKNVISETEYESFENSILESSLNIEEFIANIKAKMTDKNLNFDEIFNPILESVEVEFIYDQLKMLQDLASKIANPTEKELKCSLCKTIKEFIVEKSWDKVSESFKKINLEIHQV